MPNFACPTKVRAVANPSRVDRNVMCAGYNRCLDEAINNRWAGFSCRKCHAFKRIELSRLEWAADSLACQALIQATELSDDSIESLVGSIMTRRRHIRFQHNGWATN